MSITSHPGFIAAAVPESGPGWSTTNKTHNRAPRVLVIQLLPGNFPNGTTMRAFNGEALYVLKAETGLVVMTKGYGSIPDDAGQGNIQERKVPPSWSTNQFEFGGKNGVKPSS